MNKCVLALSVMASACTSIAHAQECADLARVIGRETERFADQNQVQMLNKANLCTSKYESSSSSQRAQIEASYALFSGGASGSSQQIQQLQESRCEGKYGAYWRSQVTSAEINRVSQTGADVIRSCLDQKSFRLVDLRIQNEAITSTFRFGGAGETIINGVIITPPDVASCSALFNGQTETDLTKLQGVRLKANDTLTLSCERKESADLAKGSTDSRKHFQGGIVGVATVAETAQVPLITYSVPPISESVAESLTKQINGLRSTADSLQSENQSLRTKLEALEKRQLPQNRAGCNLVDSATNGGDLWCPAGQYVAGAKNFSGNNFTVDMIWCCPSTP